MTRIRRNAPTVRKPPASGTKTPTVKADFKARLKKILDRELKGGQLQFQREIPLGVRFIRVPLKNEKHPDGFQYTALIPTGALNPRAKHTDPNKAPYFFVERSGGFAGITQYAGPIKTSDKAKPEPFFDKFLEGQRPGGGVHTMKAPSDNEDGGGRPIGGGGGTVTTMKAPSDNEDGGGGRVGGGGGITTMKAPSDNEDGGGGTVGGGGGTVSTMKFPSDNEDGGGGAIGGGGGGTVSTMKFPSDNEDGGGGGGTRPGPIGGATTMKYPSDNEDGGGNAIN